MNFVEFINVVTFFGMNYECCLTFERVIFAPDFSNTNYFVLEKFRAAKSENQKNLSKILRKSTSNKENEKSKVPKSYRVKIG